MFNVKMRWFALAAPAMPLRKRGSVLFFGEAMPAKTRKMSPLVPDGGSSGQPTSAPAGPVASLPELRQRATEILRLLEIRYPDLATHLEARNAWELLVATVLAAQCTDARVNKVTPELFRRWPDPAALAAAPLEDLEAVIRSTGFYHAKAKNLLGAARRTQEVYGGQVPARMEDLVTLPGVARKTANVVLFGGFGRNEGLAVDTHVKRISFRLGLTRHQDPVDVERDLMALFPREAWGGVNHRMVWFGREVCPARSPRCEACEMRGLCPQIGVVLSSGRE